MTSMEQKIAELRKRMRDVTPLDDEENFFTSDETLARFLKSRDWNLDEAERMLKATVEYRRETRPLRLDCEWCHKRPGFHSMRQIGFDESGRPVMYSNFMQTSTHKNSLDDSITHCTYLIEQAKKTMKPGVTTWVFIIDCTGMTLQSCNPKLGYGVTQIMSNHYPERLGLVICLNHSPVFHGVWKAIKVFLHPNTVSKMKLVRSKSRILSTFQKYFPDELTNWLMDEIRLNKTKPLPKAQQEFWNKPAELSAHDPRGCPSYVKDFIEPFLHKSQSKDRLNVHIPHPNIVDSIEKRVTAVTLSPEEARELAKARAVTMETGGSESDDENYEIEISEEFQIPKGANKLPGEF